jgi:S-adenosylmethionine/arginine decarboxylase-like enzyme
MNPDRTPDRAPADGAPDGAPVPFGQHLIVDLAGCDPHLVADGHALTRLVLGLCEIIGMQPFGPPWAQRFALHDPVAAGWTIVQPITTSLVSLHASDSRASVCLDVFSCRTFNAEVAVDFAVTTLGGYVTQQVGLIRGTTRPGPP